MDVNKESLQELLGTLTSSGRHYSGLIEMIAVLMEDDLSEVQFDDLERQKQFEENTRTVLETATKHRELIEQVLSELQKISTKNVMQSNTILSSDQATEPHDKPEIKAISKNDIQNIIKHVEYIRDSPRTFFSDDFSALSNFLGGFNYACFVLGVDAQYHDAYAKAQIEHGWEVLPTHPIQQMAKAGLTQDEILAVALEIELVTWKKVLNQLDE